MYILWDIMYLADIKMKDLLSTYIQVPTHLTNQKTTPLLSKHHQGYVSIFIIKMISSATTSLMSSNQATV